MEMSIICSNLARGCEKQYLPNEAESFRKLADFFKSKAAPVENVDNEAILALIEKGFGCGLSLWECHSGKKRRSRCAPLSGLEREGHTDAPITLDPLPDRGR